MRERDRERHDDKLPETSIELAGARPVARADDLFSVEPPPAPWPRLAYSLYLRAALRYRWTILAVFLALALPGGLAVWFLMPPLYRARATVEISPTNPRILYKTEENGLIPMYQQYLNSQVGIIAGNTVLQRVIERKDVRETSWYKGGPLLPFRAAGSPLERLRENLKVAPRRGTFLIDVDFVAREPADARVIVDAVLEEYQAEARSRVEQTDMMVLGTLAKTLQELQLSISGHEQVAEELRRALGTDMPEQLLTQRRLRLDELEARIAEIRRELALAEWEWQQLAQDRPELAEGESSASAAECRDFQEALLRQSYERDAEWQRLHQALEAARIELELESQRLGAAHPRMVKLNEQVRRMGERLRAREAQLRELAEVAPAPTGEQAAAGPPDALALMNRIAALRKQQELLAADLEAQRREFSGAFEKAVQLAKADEELREQRSKADLVRRRLDEKETERGPVALIREVSRPLTPSQPYHDRRPLMLAGIALLAFGAGLGTALLRWRRDQTIQEAGQLAVACPGPFLGLLPLSTPLRTEQTELSEEEHYRMLRTALLSRLDGERGCVALVTSGGPGVGKTTVAIMLARSLARCGKRVLLVDADVRAPGVAARLGIRAQPGLLDVLRGEVSDADAIVAGDAPNLSVLPAGQAQTGADAELLANGTLSASLLRWRSAYDVVLLDSPPVLPVADARILARHADGTILVVREGYCRQPDIVETLASLGLSGGRLYGTVYIGGRARSRYYDYAYGYGYHQARA